MIEATGAEDQVHDAAAARSGSQGGLRVRRLLTVAVVLALTLEGYVFRHRIGHALADIRDLDLRWAAAAVVSSLISMNCFARTQRRMVRASGTHISIVRMVGLAYAANAVNWTFPGGTALSAGYVVNRLRAWGISVPAATFALAASGVLSSVTFVGLAVFCAVFTRAGSSTSAAAAGGGLVLLLTAVAAFCRKPGAGTVVIVAVLARVNRVLRRDPHTGADGVRRFVSELTSMRPTRRDWIVATGFAALNWVADMLCLAAACHAVDVHHASTALLVRAYIAGMTASSISILPGGFGVIDVAMVFALTAGGVTAAGATAGVVLYRLISCVLLVAAGWVVWVTSRGIGRPSSVVELPR